LRESLRMTEGRKLRVLMVEDSDDDAHLLYSELASAGNDLTYKQVDSASGMRTALQESDWDVVISDHAMPSFSSLEALDLLKQSGKDIPFIIYSGNIGEQVLADLISQIFPKKSFHLQYMFKSGQKVDAAIRTDAGILPIDSKFPMENFQKLVSGETKDERDAGKKEFIKDVRHHIDDIAKKYILPEEGTMDFALMYVPSEPVYYEIVNVVDLSDYARQKRVYPVSPTTLYAHLQMILLSFEGKKIESRAREIFSLLRSIKKDYEKVDSHLSTLGGHIANAYNKFSEVTHSFTRMGQKLTLEDKMEPMEKDENSKILTP